MSEDEDSIRCTSLLCREICVALELPIQVTATAIKLVRRIDRDVHNKGVVHDRVTCAQVATLVAMKMEENMVGLRKLITKTHEVKAAHFSQSFCLEGIDVEKEVNQVRMAEICILSGFGFILGGIEDRIAHPHRYLVWLVDILVPSSVQKPIAHLCWGYVNDALLIDTSKYDNLIVACAVLVLACRDRQVPLPLEPRPWWTVVEANDDEIADVCEMLDQLKEWKPSLWT